MVNSDSIAEVAAAARSRRGDFRYLAAAMQIESAGDASARSKTSTAAGAFQFTEATWLDLVARSGERMGLQREAALIARDEAGRPVITDSGERAAILALRDKIDLAAAMAHELAAGNERYLSAKLGRRPDQAELYLAHFLGARGAAGLLTEAVAGRGDRPAAELLPRAAAANPKAFYRDSVPVSVAELIGATIATFERALAALGPPTDAKPLTSAPRSVDEPAVPLNRAIDGTFRSMNMLPSPWTAPDLSGLSLLLALSYTRLRTVDERELQPADQRSHLAGLDRTQSGAENYEWFA